MFGDLLELNFPAGEDASVGLLAMCHQWPRLYLACLQRRSHSWYVICMVSCTVCMVSWVITTSLTDVRLRHKHSDEAVKLCLPSHQPGPSRSPPAPHRSSTPRPTHRHRQEHSSRIGTWTRSPRPGRPDPSCDSGGLCGGEAPARWCVHPNGRGLIHQRIFWGSLRPWVGQCCCRVPTCGRWARLDLELENMSLGTFVCAPRTQELQRGGYLRLNECMPGIPCAYAVR